MIIFIAARDYIITVHGALQKLQLVTFIYIYIQHYLEHDQQLIVLTLVNFCSLFKLLHYSIVWMVLPDNKKLKIKDLR